MPSHAGVSRSYGIRDARGYFDRRIDGLSANLKLRERVGPHPFDGRRGDAAQLVELGFLVAPRVFTTPKKLDLSKVKVASGGDYDQDQLAEAMILFFDLPRPVYYPRDLPEALLFRAAEAKRDRRLADADAVAARMEQEGRQTKPVSSPHGVPSGRALDRGVSSSRRG